MTENIVNETVTISLKDYERLVKQADWLGWLEAAGVDNTSAWDYAHELREEFNSTMED